MLDNSEITYFDEYLTPVEADTALVKLPVPDKERVHSILFKQGVLGAMFFLSLVLAVMVLTAGMRVLSERSWLPRF